MILLLALVVLLGVIGMLAFSFVPGSPLARLRLPLAGMVACCVLLGGGVAGYVVFMDEATGVCIRAGGSCAYATRGQCSERWEPTESFYTADATCRELGFQNP